MDVHTRSLYQMAAAAFAGAALMYYLDPQQGRRRRALVRDKAVAVSHDTADVARGQGQRVASSMRGMVAATRARFRRSDDPVDERTLHARVRACLGRVADHPKAIQVEVTGSDVRLLGDVLGRDVAPIIKAVERVRGVERVDNALTVHASAANVPSLQGEPEGADGRRWMPMWSVLALAAPVAILALSARSSPVRRFAGSHRLALPHPFRSQPLAEPRRIAQRSTRRLKDYFNALRAS